MTTRHILYILYGLAFIVYCTVALMSYGFDDEFFNILLIEKHGLNAFFVTQTMDVHPPLSYIINSVLYRAFGDWGIVRLFSASALCASLIYLCEYIKTKDGELVAILTFILLASSPALLLWGTSVRWYAYFLPILIWLLVLPKTQGWSMWVKLGVGLVGLGYTGYLAFVLAPALVLFYWLSSSQQFEVKLKQLSVSIGVAALLYSPQLLTFLNVHFPNRESQTGSLFLSFAGFFIAQFSNQGVFPLSIAALVSATGTLLILYVTLRSQPIQKLSTNPKCMSYVLFSILIVASGVAAKFRNLVIATPLQLIWFASIKPNVSMKKLFYIGMVFIIVGNFWGSVNVYRHQDTTKNSWNFPVKEVLSIIKKEYEACDKDAIIFTHDPTLSYHLKYLPISSTGVYSTDINPKVKETYQCVFVLKTFIGSVSPYRYAKMLDEVNNLKYSQMSVINLQQDSFYDYKVKLDNRYPKYAITILKFTDVKNTNILSSWQP
jgi:hypothetical protein